MQNIQHQVDQHCFVVEGLGDAAILRYTLYQAAAKTVIDFNSTFVSPELRGQGLAEKLVRTGIAWAKMEGYQLQASCWYAEKFIREI